MAASLNQNTCLYLFLDEGGNFDFSPSGTPWFTLTCVSMIRPFAMCEQWDAYKYDCLEYGLPTEFFHCTYDNNYVRERLFSILSNHLDKIAIDSIIVEKAKTGPALRADRRFYPEMLGYLLRYVFDRYSHYSELIVITDSIPHQKKRRAIEKGIKVTLSNMLPDDVRYRVLHHSSRSHYGLQIADYCNWAILRKWTKGETRYYDYIKHAIRSEFEIFRRGRIRYY